MERDILFKSTIATSAPLNTSARLMTSPSPWAPPVTTATLPWSENVESVGGRTEWESPFVPFVPFAAILKSIFGFVCRYQIVYFGILKSVS